MSADRFITFHIGPSRSRLAFLSTLRAGLQDYLINTAALDCMCGRALTGTVTYPLAAYPVEVFANEAIWKAHLVGLDIDQLAVTPDPVRIATEGAFWGTIQARGLRPNTVIGSDNAGRFRLGEHGLDRHLRQLETTLRIGSPAMDGAGIPTAAKVDEVIILSAC